MERRRKATLREPTFLPQHLHLSSLNIYTFLRFFAFSVDFALYGVLLSLSSFIFLSLASVSISLDCIFPFIFPLHAPSVTCSSPASTLQVPIPVLIFTLISISWRYQLDYPSKSKQSSKEI
ncbi:hypothetical protein CC80DRAFT_113562 [Byssothecium circinans]|uniref:Transmembrane protein n=1 Tax=Byssothecium circinans TaxID=147558 RepID=A0A6A5TPR3_9PLEO|nr:hypothetical protein CC80DRAFT_113562 [Byssothecium circinans]